jgi:hypothetical protein
MDNTLTREPTAEEIKKVETALEKIFAEVERIDRRIDKDQQEIDRLKLETQAILAQLKAR